MSCENLCERCGVRPVGYRKKRFCNECAKIVAKEKEHERYLRKKAAAEKAAMPPEDPDDWRARRKLCAEIKGMRFVDERHRRCETCAFRRSDRHCVFPAGMCLLGHGEEAG